MRLLLRFGIFFILAGLLAGWLLRAALPGRQLLVYLLAALPWLGHSLYLSNFALQGAVAAAQLGIFLGISLVLVLIVGVSLWRLRGIGRALAPLILAALYSLGPLLWFSRVLEAGSSRLDTIPTVLYWGASFAAASLLFTYGWSLLERGQRNDQH